MISVILYGRNDSYGYNLHKRAALSLNCIAEVLDAPGDEILFVDYNSPDDLPTFPEAIRDTLTPRARALLRVLRVRPDQHRRFAPRNHLVAIEPLVRNVALRRSNSANRWVLSSNTDMIFVPEQESSLSAIAADLPDGYYHLPRFELPEMLWEELDRADPAGTIANVGAWGRRFHLDEIVTIDHPAIRFDGPGDFQLMLRQELHDIAGFDERMALGWHVDSNIAVRLAMRHGAPGSLEDRLRGYHCNHTRQVTPAHRPGALQNDWVRFVDDITRAEAPDQPRWGMDGEPVEELRLGAEPPFLAALARAVPAAMPAPTTAGWGTGVTGYDTDHVAPFVLDALSTAPPDTVLGWIGTTPALLERVRTAWPALVIAAPVQAALAGPEGLPPAEIAAILNRASILVFDFALPAGLNPGAPSAAPGAMLGNSAIAAVAMALGQAAIAERLRMERHPPRRFIAVNAIWNDLTPLVAGTLGAPQAPFATRLRQGFVRPLAARPGPVGREVADGVLMPPGRRGQAMVCHLGPLPPGSWAISVDLAPPSGLPWRPGPVKLEALHGAMPLARRYLLAGLPWRSTLRLALDIPADARPEDVVLRLHTTGQAATRIAAIRLAPR